MTQADIFQRRNRISEYIQLHGSLSTVRACQLFGVSDETIRKDFAYLEEMHIVEKVYGGARLHRSDETKPYAARRDEHYLAKAAICRRAAELIPAEGGLSVGLDTGTTFSLLAGYLAQRSGNFIVTSSNPVIQQIAGSRNRLYVLGGEYDPHNMYFQGESTCRALRELSLDLVFLGTGGVRGLSGISTAGFADVELKREYIRRSRKRVVLTDSSKFFKTALVEVAPWDEVDVLITDKNIPAEDADRLRGKLELILV